MTEAPVQTDDKDERSKKLRQAYGNATTALREKHRDEFDNLYAESARSLGVDYTPRPSAEQKASQQVKELIAEYPHLRAELLAEFAKEEPEDDGFEEEPEPERTGPTAI
jgi:hypothetical protein